ncbi:MAG: FkbM family methyltransferase [Pirellulales bacterium]|nr:FkbM family methyltransferase [Pirellulales bacterium]
MLDSLLQRVLARRGANLGQRAVCALALRLWKLGRCVPVLNRLQGTLTVRGLRLRARLFSYDDLLCVRPDYEAALRRWLPPSGAVAIDAGAYIGRHTLELAQAVGPTGLIVAIEPLPENMTLLAYNVRLNGYPRAHLCRCALAADTGEAVLRFGIERSTATLDPQRATAARLDRQVVVAQRRLDDLLADLGIASIDYLKFDVEGAELAALQGAERTLRASPRATLAIELHGSASAHGQVRAWLVERGYEIEELNDAGRHFFIAARRQTVAFVPSERAAALLRASA